MGIIFFIVIIIISFYFIKNKVKIDFQSFFRRSLKLKRGKFGVYCFCGKQGSGKTYSLTKFLLRNNHHHLQVYSNVTFMDNIKYVKLNTIADLLSLKDKRNCLIIFDEIFTFMTKNTRISDEIMEFLSQMRKQENIFMTTCQEWLELPMTFRRYVRIQIDCNTIPLGSLGGILIEEYYNAMKMKWSTLENEYIAPILDKKISKYERSIMQSYDTYERIKPLLH